MREFARDFFIGLAVFAAVFTIAILDSRAARLGPALGSPSPAAYEATQTSVLSPGDVGSGTLFLRQADDGGAGDATTIPAVRLHTNVDITITGPMARATVTQRFQNTQKGWVEGIYAFPLPENAAVDVLSMRIGRRFIKSEITSHEKARQYYEAARIAGRKANLLTPHRPNVFAASVANIGPGEEVTIKFEYQETLHKDGDAYSLRFPLVIATRHGPRAEIRPVTLDEPTEAHLPKPPARDPAREEVNSVSLQVRINSGFPLGKVTSDTHEIALRRTGDATAVVALHQGLVPADRNFELAWKPKGTSSPFTAAYQEDPGEHSYVTAMLMPPKNEAALAPVSREIIFVVDTSGSMNGPPISQTRESLKLALQRLRPGDRFNVIPFNSSFEQLFQEPVSVTKESVGIATHFVSKLQARGGTRMLPALLAALADPRQKDKRRVRQVVLITDGAVSDEGKLFSILAQKRGRSRVFTVGIGSAPNSFLMRRAAEIGRGSFLHISTQSQIRERMNGLFRRLERPVITDLRLEWASGLRVDMWPNPLPDLYLGDPLVITARLSALKGDLKISGTMSGRPWTQALSLATAKTATGVGKYWARHKIASLEARRYSGQSASDVDKAIEAVAIEHDLVSRMTSLVTLDVTPLRPEDQPLASEDLPINLPAGWVYDGMVSRQTAAGNPNETRLGSPTKLVSAPENAQPALKPQPDKAVSDKASTNQPDTQTIAALNGSKFDQASAKPGDVNEETSSRAWTLTVMGVIFALMSALTLGLWRHLRRAVEPSRKRRGENQAF